MNVYIYSQEDMEKMLKDNTFPEHVGVINIGEPLDKREPGYYRTPTTSIDFVRLHNDVHAIYLYNMEAEELAENGLTKKTFFPHIERTVHFIKFRHSNEQDIICYSRHGISRSAACAAAILEYYYKKGDSIFSDGKYKPNKLIYNLLLEALREIDI